LSRNSLGALNVTIFGGRHEVDGKSLLSIL
jgi:hypothetical protein